METRLRRLWNKVLSRISSQTFDQDSGVERHPIWKTTIERYQKHESNIQSNNKAIEENMQNLNCEAASMANKIEFLEISERKFLGEGLGSCSTDDLEQIESQLEQSLKSIRARKTQLFKEHIEQLKEKEKALEEENAMLGKKCGATQEREIVPYGQISPDSDVETGLFIGRPERGSTCHTS